MIRNKKILLLIFFIIIGSVYFLNSSYSAGEETCGYTAKINECIKSDSKRSIEEFICIDGSSEEITYQIIIDEKFKEIDDKINIYLTELETDKDKFFGPEVEFTYLDAVDEIENNFASQGKYYLEYENICGVNIINEAMSCLLGQKTSINLSKDMFKKSTCMNLASTQLNIYRQVAYDILILNKANVRKDVAKKYIQQERTKYDELLTAMMVNMGYMERIAAKWKLRIENAFPN